MIKIMMSPFVYFSMTINCLAGVMPSQSRIIYHSVDKSKGVMLVNTNKYPVIVQNWIDKGEGSPESAGIPFVSTPSVLRLESDGVRGIRVMYTQGELPQDRESLFWFNIYEIPPEKPGINPENSVLVTMNTQIKLFYRPPGIAITPDEAIKKVICHLSGRDALICSDPTPIHIPITRLQVKNKNGLAATAINSELMMTPFGEVNYNFKTQALSFEDITFNYIDDNGNQHVYKYNSDGL